MFSFRMNLLDAACPNKESLRKEVLDLVKENGMLPYYVTPLNVTNGPQASFSMPWAQCMVWFGDEVIGCLAWFGVSLLGQCQ